MGHSGEEQRPGPLLVPVPGSLAELPSKKSRVQRQARDADGAWYWEAKPVLQRHVRGDGWERDLLWAQVEARGRLP